MIIRSSSREETINAGLKLGRLLKKGDIVCLNGELGSGKTVFVAGIAAALGVGGYITSPTFTIINEYKARIPLYHFDAYRIANPEEMYELGFEEYIDGNGIVVIEWADLIRDVLPDEYISVDISRDKEGSENNRIIKIDFRGEKYAEYEYMF